MSENLETASNRVLREVKNLYVDTVSYKPQNYPFYDAENLEKWEVAVEQTEEEQENEEFVPMMNYRYPLPSQFERDMRQTFGEEWRTEIKEQLDNCTLVYFHEADEYFLALTGGGMDLSWEICATYVNLGYLPPVHFCDLPRMAGKNYASPQNSRIINACIRSAKTSSGWGESTLKKLKGFLGAEK